MRFTVPLSELEAGQGRADLAIFCTLLQGRWEDRKITKKDQNRPETRLSPWRRQGSPGRGRRGHLPSSERGWPAAHLCADRSPRRGRVLRHTPVPEAGSTLVFQESGKTPEQKPEAQTF